MEMDILVRSDGAICVTQGKLSKEQITLAFQECYKEFVRLRPSCRSIKAEIGIHDEDYGDPLPDGYVMIKEK